MIDEILGIKTHEELMTILDENEVSREPQYCGYGIEVYHNHDKQIQVISDFRQDNRIVKINRGF